MQLLDCRQLHVWKMACAMFWQQGNILFVLSEFKAKSCWSMFRPSPESHTRLLALPHVRFVCLHDIQCLLALSCLVKAWLVPSWVSKLGLEAMRKGMEWVVVVGSVSQNEWGWVHPFTQDPKPTTLLHIQHPPPSLGLPDLYTSSPAHSPKTHRQQE